MSSTLPPADRAVGAAPDATSGTAPDARPGAAPAQTPGTKNGIPVCMLGQPTASVYVGPVLVLSLFILQAMDLPFQLYALALCSFLAFWSLVWIAGLKDSRRHKAIRRSLVDCDLRVCLRCGYALAMLPDHHRCPECGERYSFEASREARQRWLNGVLMPDATVLPFYQAQFRDGRTKCQRCGKALVDGSCSDCIKELQFQREMSRPRFTPSPTELEYIFGVPADTLAVRRSGVPRCVPRKSPATVRSWIAWAMIYTAVIFVWDWIGGPGRLLHMLSYTLPIIAGTMIHVRWYDRHVQELRNRVGEHELRVCLKCGYGLSALPDHHRCPECGEPYSVETLRRVWQHWLGGHFMASGEVARARDEARAKARPTCIRCGAAKIDGTCRECPSQQPAMQS